MSFIMLSVIYVGNLITVLSRMILIAMLMQQMSSLYRKFIVCRIVSETLACLFLFLACFIIIGLAIVQHQLYDSVHVEVIEPS